MRGTRHEATGNREPSLDETRRWSGCCVTSCTIVISYHTPSAVLRMGQYCVRSADGGDTAVLAGPASLSSCEMMPLEHVPRLSRDCPATVPCARVPTHHCFLTYDILDTLRSHGSLSQRCGVWRHHYSSPSSVIHYPSSTVIQRAAWQIEASHRPLQTGPKSSTPIYINQPHQRPKPHFLAAPKLQCFSASMPQ